MGFLAVRSFLFCRNAARHETTFSNKISLNSSPDLFFVAAAGKIMVITAEFLWLFPF